MESRQARQKQLYICNNRRQLSRRLMLFSLLKTRLRVERLLKAMDHCMSSRQDSARSSSHPKVIKITATDPRHVSRPAYSVAYIHYFTELKLDGGKAMSPFFRPV